jgi:hypothetical protein
VETPGLSRSGGAEMRKGQLISSTVSPSTGSFLIVDAVQEMRSRPAAWPW